MRQKGQESTSRKQSRQDRKVFASEINPTFSSESALMELAGIASAMFLMIMALSRPVNSKKLLPSANQWMFMKGLYLSASNGGSQIEARY
jgi:hypothetical protein